ncbi:MAG: hypothetical protein AB7J30_04825 [Hyphomicrobium sp.]|uniref:hypothetical protein n=1 Tax=Hyphomicrobium sp. TaxID=82 RepID=UPI003D0C63D9
MTTFQAQSLAKIISALATIALTTTAGIACEPYCVGGSHSTVESPAPMDNSSGAPNSTYENLAPPDEYSGKGAPNSTYENAAPPDESSGFGAPAATLESPTPEGQQDAAGAGEWYDPQNAPLEAYDPYANAPMIAPAP